MTRIHSLLSCLTTLTFLGFSGAARAAAPSEPASSDGTTPSASASGTETPPPSEASERHHRGFYARTHLGGGYRTASATVAGDELRVTGGGAGFGIAAGGAVAEDLIVVGEILGDVATNPSISGADGSVTADGSKMTFIALGPGVTYYIMPANVHLGLSVLLSKLSLSREGGASAQTQWGFGGAARVGKDFWLGQNIGIGVMGQVALAAMKDSQSAGAQTPTWKSTTATLALEFTYH